MSRLDATQQLLQAHTEVDWPKKRALVKFFSIEGEHELREHAHCSICFQDYNLQKKLQGEAASVQQKMKDLQDGISTGIFARFNTPMLYRAIRTLNKVYDDYRNIDMLILNSATYESCSRLTFGCVKHKGSFHTHPSIIDAMAQSCGFTLNCNDNTDLDEEIFMTHGWKAFQMFEPMELEKEYTLYTHVVEADRKMWHGDIIVFHGDRVIASFNEIAFQAMHRRSLKVIVQHENEGKLKMHPTSQQKPVSVTNWSPTTSVAPPMAVSTNATDSQSLKLAKALAIISEESGLAVESLPDSTAFGHLGIDSLFGLNIFARFREEIGISLDFKSLFFDYPSIGELKAFFMGSRADTGGVSAFESSPAGSKTSP